MKIQHASKNSYANLQHVFGIHIYLVDRNTTVKMYSRLGDRYKYMETVL